MRDMLTSLANWTMAALDAAHSGAPHEHDCCFSLTTGGSIA